MQRILAQLPRVLHYPDAGCAEGIIFTQQISLLQEAELLCVIAFVYQGFIKPLEGPRITTQMKHTDINLQISIQMKICVILTEFVLNTVITNLFQHEYALRDAKDFCFVHCFFLQYLEQCLPHYMVSKYLLKQIGFLIFQIRGVKLIFTGGSISLAVAFRGLK